MVATPVVAEPNKDLSDSNVTLRSKVISCVTEEKIKELLVEEGQETKDIIETSTKGLSSQLTGISEKFTSFQESLTFINKQYDDLKKEFSELKKLFGSTSSEVKALKGENTKLREDLSACVARVIELEQENRKQQQWVRLQNVELVGVPEHKDEELIDIVVKVLNHAGSVIQPSDLEFAHRVQPRRAASASKSRPIIVRLRQRAVKDRVVAAARRHRSMTAKEVGFIGGESRIYINEHLTRENKMLLSSCRQKAKEIGYKYVWTKNCRVYVKKNDESPPVGIDSKADVDKLF